MYHLKPFGVSATLKLLPLQKQFISQNSGNQRFLYNHLWAEIKDKNLTDKVKFTSNTYVIDPETGKRIKEEKVFEVAIYSEKHLTELWRKIESENEFLNLSPSRTKQITIQSLNKAIISGFKKIHSMPVFKKKSVATEGFTIYNYGHENHTGIKYLPEKSSLYVPAIKTYLARLELKLSKKELERLTEFRIKENKKNRGKTFSNIPCKQFTFKVNSAGQYFVSTFQDREVLDKSWLYENPETLKTIGIDLGFKNKIIDSNGNVVPRVKIRAQYEDRIKDLQRKIAKRYEEKRDKKGVITEKVKRKKEKNLKRLEKNPEKYHKLIKIEKDYLKNHTKIIKRYDISKEDYLEVSNYPKVKKLKRSVALWERKIANKRNYENHKLSKTIVKNYDIIALENLNIRGMSKIFGPQVLDLGLSDFVGKIKYKADIQGKLVVQVDRFFPSSKLCNCCGCKNTKLKLSDRTWTCESCGKVLDRDVNAARNIEKEGLRILLAGRDISLPSDTEAKARFQEELSSRLALKDLSQRPDGRDGESQKEVVRDSQW